jgi:hypothetical protein
MSGFISGLDANGTLTGDELLEISQLSTTVTYTATTLSAAATDNSFNDSASQFVAEGFAVGDRVQVAGFTGNVANNIIGGTITALTTAKMTIGGTDGDVIVDDAAGESVTITKWTTRRASAQDLADLGTGGGSGGSPFRGARVRLTADDTAQNITTETAVSFDVADFDTDSFFSAGAPTRLTIPAGVSKVSLVGQAYITSSTNDTVISVSIFHHNSGGTLLRFFSQRFIECGVAQRMLNVASGPIAVSVGDYFVLMVQQETDTSVTIEGDDTGQTYLSLMVLDASSSVGSTFRGALVYQASSQTGANYFTGAPVAIPFDAESYDTDLIHDNVTNNTRLTVPAGVTKVRLSGCASISNSTSGNFHELTIYKNGSLTYNGSPANRAEVTVTGHGLQIVTPVLDVTAGDYFELKLSSETDTSIDLNSPRTWFAMEIVAGAGGVQSIPILAGAMTPRTTNGASLGSQETTTNKIMLPSLAYDASTIEYAQFLFPMPKSWNEGSVTAQFIWTGASGSGDVIWGIQAVAISDGDALDAAFGTAQEVTDSLTTALDNHTSSFTSAVTIGGTPAEGDTVCFQVYRKASDGGDTLAVDALLLGIRLNITTNAGDDS